MLLPDFKPCSPIYTPVFCTLVIQFEKATFLPENPAVESMDSHTSKPVSALQGVKYIPGNY